MSVGLYEPCAFPLREAAYHLCQRLRILRSLGGRAIVLGGHAKVVTDVKLQVEAAAPSLLAPTLAGQIQSPGSRCKSTR